MHYRDIDPYWLIEHASVDELLALVRARDEVRDMCTASTMPAAGGEPRRDAVRPPAAGSTMPARRQVFARDGVREQAGSTMPVRDDEVELTPSPVRTTETEPVPKRSDTVVLARATKAR
jgi:hypothetical protein